LQSSSQPSRLQLAWEQPPEAHPFVEVSFDLILIGAIGQHERTLKAAIAALNHMIGVPLLIPLGLLFALQ
jgi:hypothetical protein